MAAVCDVCGKGPGFGKKVARLGRNAIHRRVKGRSSRRFDPNIQTVHAQVGPSQRKRLNVCTSCIKAGKVARG